MIKHVLLDLDGVLVDFIGGVMKRLKIERSIEELYRTNLGEWNFFKFFDGITERDFWNTCDELFWSGLEWMSDGRLLLKGVVDLVGKENISFWSSPANHNGCLEGKRKWCRSHLTHFKSFIFGSSKERGSRSDTVLIDDADHNVNRFAFAGGKIILVPRIWNSLHTLRNDSVEYTLNQLKELL